VTAPDVAALVDHTLLKAETTAADVERLCAEAVELGCAAVCVNLGLVEVAGPLLPAGGPALCCVLDFPLGAAGRAARVAQARAAVQAGVAEADLVADLGALAAGDLAAVQRDVAAVREALGDGVLLKVILETALLGPASIPGAARAAVAGGAQIVKTSTGFHPAGGASAEAVAALAAAVPGTGVKASGGIRTWDDAVAMLAAGATRLGLSATRAVLAGAPGGRAASSGR
jgi:deoxyribose-phosphate aldolase